MIAQTLSSVLPAMDRMVQMSDGTIVCENHKICFIENRSRRPLRPDSTRLSGFDPFPFFDALVFLLSGGTMACHSFGILSFFFFLEF